MKETLNTLIEHLKGTSGPTRVVIGAGVALVLIIGTLAGYRSAHPHMIPLYTGLEPSEFSSVTAALSNAGVRFDTSSPPAPFSVFVGEGDRYAALNAVGAAGALNLGTKGIPSAAGGSTVFMSDAERNLINRKRDWEDLEKQLEVISWIAQATVRISPGQRGALGRRQPPPTVSVMIRLRGAISPSHTQRETLASIVRAATGAPTENISISDDSGHILFDGTRDEALDAVLQFEESFAESRSRQAQEFLDQAYGVGNTLVHVTGEWDHHREESVGEALDPEKRTVSEIKSETKTPVDNAAVGGPAGTASNIDQGSTANLGTGAPAAVAETTDTEKRFTYSSKTTHLIQSAPILKRLSVTLLASPSLKGENGEGVQLADLEKEVQALVGFDQTRDLMSSGWSDKLEPPAAPPPPPAPPNRYVTLLLERGVEILAGAALLILLLRSLKKASASARQAPAQGRGAGALPGEEVDLDLLARRHIEQLIENEPEKVGVLLSRWALGDPQHSGAGK